MQWILIAADSTFAESLGNTLSTLWMIVQVAFGIGLVIFVHELGHFLAAKFCGVKVEKFYIGFDLPPWRLFGLTMPGRFASFRSGETEYGIGIIPLGGYVKMLGQDDNPANAEKEAQRAKLQQPAGEGEGTNDREQLDPRSYPAKSVLQRMVIISAGIVMNLIFAVIFAAIAYQAGVRYIPTVVAGTTPGDPAWVEGLQPGDKILQIGRDAEPSEHLRFDKDLKLAVAISGFGRQTPEEVELLVRRGEKPEWIKLRPRNRLNDPQSPATIGVLFPFSTTLSSKMPVTPYMAAGKAKPALEGGDRIIAFNGKRLDVATAEDGKPANMTIPEGDLLGIDLARLLAQHAQEAVRLQVHRGTKEEGDGANIVEVEVPPQPRKWLGLTMEIGPIAAIQNNSPAASAGLKAGDRLLKINGKSVGDPVTLPQRLPEILGEQASGGPVQLLVQRTEGDAKKEITVDITPRDDHLNDVGMLAGGLGGYLGLDTFGIAYSVQPTIASVAAGSDAEKHGLQTGDKVVGIQLVPRDTQVHEEAVELLGDEYNEYTTIDEVNNWIAMDLALQKLPEKIDVRLTTRRGTKSTTTVLPLVELPDQYSIDRGLNFVYYQRVHTADSFAQAVKLGYRETKERLAEVGSVLGMLVTGRVSLDNLGGPIRIAAFAGSEAAQGLPRLLMFLTFLSANLALLNALPIPVLDGGHFMFLLVEGIFRRPVSERWQMRLTFVGFAFLMLLMVFVFAKDIQWLWSWV